MLCPQAFWKHLNICNITSPEIAINWHTSVPYDKQFTLCNSHYQKIKIKTILQGKYLHFNRTQDQQLILFLLK